MAPGSHQIFSMNGDTERFGEPDKTGSLFKQHSARYLALGNSDMYLIDTSKDQPYNCLPHKINAGNGAVYIEKPMSQTKAYILVETRVGKSGDVTRSLNRLESVVSVDQVTGPYDIITVVKGPNLNAVGDFVTTKVHTIPGITRTVTCLSVAHK